MPLGELARDACPAVAERGGEEGRKPPRHQPEHHDQSYDPPADQEGAEVAGRQRVGVAEHLVGDPTHEDRHRLAPAAAHGTAASGACARDSARIPLRSRRARSARTQSAVTSTPRARPATKTTGGPITTIVDASGTLGVAKRPM